MYQCEVFVLELYFFSTSISIYLSIILSIIEVRVCINLLLFQKLGATVSGPHLPQTTKSNTLIVH